MELGQEDQLTPYAQSDVLAVGKMTESPQYSTAGIRVSDNVINDLLVKGWRTYGTWPGIAVSRKYVSEGLLVADKCCVRALGGGCTQINWPPQTTFYHAIRLSYLDPLAI